MPNVTPRARALLDLLTERGFAAVSAEILGTLSHGVRLPNEQRPRDNQPEDGSPPRAQEPDRFWYPETPEDQARVVANMIDALLLEPLRMRQRSEELLSGLMGRQVVIESIDPDGEAHKFDRELATSVLHTVGDLRKGLESWLAAPHDAENA